MAVPMRRNRPFTHLFEAHGALLLTVVLSFTVVAFGQFLHTAPAQSGAASVVPVFRWVGDALLTMPFAAAAVWTGHAVADRAGWEPTSRALLDRALPDRALPDRAVLHRALLISALFAVFLVPGWYITTEVAGLTHTTDAAAHAHTAHTAGSYGVADRVVYLLLAAPLAVAAGWAGYRMAAGRRSRLARVAGAPARRTVLMGRISVGAVLAAAAAAAAWFVHEAANRADASRVLYTTATQSALVHSHAFFARGHGAHLPPAAPATAAPFSFAYQVARAFQDGVTAQVVGLPVTALVLLWGAWLLRDRDRYRPEGRDHEEVVEV